MTKATTTEFLARAGTPKHVDEAKLALAYIAADRSLGEARISLISHISAVEVDGKFVPSFDDEVGDCIPALSASEKAASAVKKDVERYLSLLEDAQSISQLTESLGRIRINVRNAEFDSKSRLEREVRSRKGDAAECMTLPIVVDSFAHSEKVAKENQQSIDDLLSRIASAKKILGKY